MRKAGAVNCPPPGEVMPLPRLGNRRACFDHGRVGQSCERRSGGDDQEAELASQCLQEAGDACRQDHPQRIDPGDQKDDQTADRNGDWYGARQAVMGDALSCRRSKWSRGRRSPRTTQVLLWDRLAPDTAQYGYLRNLGSITCSLAWAMRICLAAG